MKSFFSVVKECGEKDTNQVTFLNWSLDTVYIQSFTEQKRQHTVQIYSRQENKSKWKSQFKKKTGKNPKCFVHQDGPISDSELCQLTQSLTSCLLVSAQSLMSFVIKIEETPPGSLTQNNNTQRTKADSSFLEHNCYHVGVSARMQKYWKEVW